MVFMTPSREDKLLQFSEVRPFETSVLTQSPAAGSLLPVVGFRAFVNIATIQIIICL